MNLIIRIILLSFGCLLLTVAPTNAAIWTVTKTADTNDTICNADCSLREAIFAEGYVSRGIFHRKFLADAFHVAFASFHKIDYLVTWNFGHLANVRKQARIRLFNTAAGFFSPIIVTPEFLVHS